VGRDTPVGRQREKDGGAREGAETLVGKQRKKETGGGGMERSVSSINKQTTAK